MRFAGGSIRLPETTVHPTWGCWTPMTDLIPPIETGVGGGAVRKPGF